MLQKTLDEIKSASPIQWLSIISDFATILGVSVATLVAGPFLGNITGMGFSTLDFLWAIFFYFIYILLFVTASIYLIKFVIRMFKERGYFLGFLSISLLVLTWALLFSSATPLKTFFGTWTGSRYMLVAKPEIAVVKFEKVSVEKRDKYMFINGSVIFNEGYDATDYVVVIYSINDKTGEYEYQYIGLNKTSSKINSKGKFTLPKIEIDENSLGQSYLAIFRLSDEGQYMGRVFPNKLTQVPSMSTDALGVVVESMGKWLTRQLNGTKTVD